MRNAITVMRDVAVLVAAVMFIVIASSRQLDHAARLAILQNQIYVLDQAYKQVVFNDKDTKGIYQQIFRQNEILLEYHKLMLTRDLFEIPLSSLLSPPSLPLPKPPS